MLIIKGICLLFSHLPTSHTTVRAVPHTAVPIWGAVRDMTPSALDSLLGAVYLLEKVFLVEWYFHDVVFTHPHKGLHSPIPFGFRPISLGAAINLG